MAKKYKIGDSVVITARRSDKLIPIKGKILSMKINYGHEEYIIGECRVDDFSVRNIN